MNTDSVKNPIIFPLVLLAIVFVSLGFIQILFQSGIQTAINDVQTNIDASNRNFEGIQNQTQILNKLLIDRTTMFQHLENSTDTILNTLDARQNEHEKQTALLIRGLERTGNATAQAAAIEKIENNVKSLQRIERALNITADRLLNNNSSQTTS